MTAAELLDLTDDELDATAHRLLVARHRAARVAVTARRCTPGCLASADPWGPCQCPCQGRLHGALWAADALAEREGRP